MRQSPGRMTGAWRELTKCSLPGPFPIPIPTAAGREGGAHGGSSCCSVPPLPPPAMWGNPPHGSFSWCQAGLPRARSEAPVPWSHCGYDHPHFHVGAADTVGHPPSLCAPDKSVGLRLRVGSGPEQDICPSVCLWSCTGDWTTLWSPVLSPSRHLTDLHRKPGSSDLPPELVARGKMRELTSGLLTGVQTAKAARGIWFLSFADLVPATRAD